MDAPLPRNSIEPILVYDLSIEWFGFELVPARSIQIHVHNAIEMNCYLKGANLQGWLNFVIFVELFYSN